jgi:predicted nucleotidyltransferase
VRLSEVEIETIKNVIKTFLPNGFLGELLLFGSRVDDSKKGGDIDLALVGFIDSQVLDLRKIDYKIVAAIKSSKAIGDQRVDLKIINQTESSVRKQALKIKDSHSLGFPS